MEVGEGGAPYSPAPAAHKRIVIPNSGRTVPTPRPSGSTAAPAAATGGGGARRRAAASPLGPASPRLGAGRRLRPLLLLLEGVRRQRHHLLRGLLGLLHGLQRLVLGRR